jgi:phosphocarrier protein HPr
MKNAQVVIPWKNGLHLRPASRLVRLALAYKSVVLLKVGTKVADARSVLAILLLCTVAGMVIELEISGEDEDDLLTSILSLFTQEPLGNASNQVDSVA